MKHRILRSVITIDVRAPHRRFEGRLIDLRAILKYNYQYPDVHVHTVDFDDDGKGMIIAAAFDELPDKEFIRQFAEHIRNKVKRLKVRDLE